MRINFESIEVFVEAPAYFTVRHSIAVERGDGAGTIRDELHDCASFPDQKRKIAAVVDGPPACISEFQPGTGNICQVKKQNGFASGKLFAVERDCSDGLKPFRIFDGLTASSGERRMISGEFPAASSGMEPIAVISPSVLNSTGNPEIWFCSKQFRET